MADDSGEVSHAYKTRTALIDNRHPREPLLIAGELRSDVFQEAVIDLVNDLEVARQQATKNFDWPFFQSFGKQGVVGVGYCLARHLPGHVPSKLVLIYQQS